MSIQSISPIWGNTTPSDETATIKDFLGFDQNGRGECLVFAEYVVYSDSRPDLWRTNNIYPYEIHDILKQAGLSEEEKKIITDAVAVYNALPKGAGKFSRISAEMLEKTRYNSLMIVDMPNRGDGSLSMPFPPREEKYYDLFYRNAVDASLRTRPVVKPFNLSPV